MNRFVILRNFAVIAVLLTVATPDARAEIFGGIDFPDGLISFADRVIRYDPAFGGSPPSGPDFTNPLEALGPPRLSPPGQFVSIGDGGLLELGFVDNVLTNSGNNGVLDLHIFEIGPSVERTFVAIHPTPDTRPFLDPGGDINGDGFFEIGSVSGGTASIDLDDVFPGVAAGVLRFDAVQLIDDFFDNYFLPVGLSAGADIDAVGAISTAFTPGPTGLDPRDPLLPILVDAVGRFVFNDVPSERWFDPPYVDAYQFQTTDGSHFTEVGMPPLDVVGDSDGMYLVTSILGAQSVAAGANLVFASPVDFFTVSGIAPLLDGADPEAFPTYLEFDRPTASFTMTPVPEPNTVLLAAMTTCFVITRNSRSGPSRSGCRRTIP